MITITNMDQPKIPLFLLSPGANLVRKVMKPHDLVKPHSIGPSGCLDQREHSTSDAPEAPAIEDRLNDLSKTRNNSTLN